MKTTLQTLALATFYGLSALTLSSCGGSDSSSSSSSPSNILDSVAGQELQSLNWVKTEANQAHIDAILFDETAPTAYIAGTYTALVDGQEVDGYFSDIAAPYTYEPSTGVVTLTLTGSGMGSAGTLTMTLIVKNDSILTVQSGSTLIFDGASETTYSIINTEFEYNITY